MKKQCLSILIMVLCLGCFYTNNAQTSQPNILFILTDDENIDTIGSYGNDANTPNIDKLANKGIRFENANVVHSVCSPSRYAILTGRYYENNYHKNYLSKFPEDEPSCVGNRITLEGDGMNIASVLQKNGYNTGFVGKFHLGRHDVLGTNENWKENGLYTYGRDEDPRNDIELDKKLKKNHQWWVETIKGYGFNYANGIYSANLRELHNNNLFVHNVEWTADVASEFIEQQQKSKKPFFLFVSTTYPHGPAPEQLKKGKYIRSLDADPTLTGAGVINKNIQQKIASRNKIKKVYGSSNNKTSVTTAWWDKSVGTIIEKLKETGQYENTIIVYTSDHGKKNAGKTTLYETGVHVPLIVHWPKKIKKGRVYNPIIGSVDFVPTLFDLCKVNIPNTMKIDGISFKSVILGSEKPVRDALLLKMGYAAAIKTDNWKYIALRYPLSVEDDIRKGKLFAGHRKEFIKQPYYMQHKQLAQRSKNANPHYFERNQLYAYKTDITEHINMYSNNFEVSKKMREVLEKELKKVNLKRPFGEFVGKNKNKFLYLKNVILLDD